VLYDTHAHLDYPEFASEIPQIIQRAKDAGVTKIITIGTTVESSERAIRLAAEFNEIYAVVGWHPSYCAEAPADVRSELRRLAQSPKVVALGETGLDFSRLPSKNPEAKDPDDSGYKARQIELFKQHLEVAAEFGLNCVIHQREAFEETIEVLEPFSKTVRGVFHCFVDGPDREKRIEALGSLVSFTGIVTFKNAEVVRETIRETSLDGMMVETDAPYLAPVPYRGKRCEPWHVSETAKKIAEIKGCALDELGRATCETAEKFFRGLAK
jgi:TatD DNase family protein